MTFSIIVPAYNIENYLAICLDSLIPALEQTDEILISLRADAGKDRTGAIASEYAASFTNVHLVTQTGRGLSDARNCAMRQAKGDYLIFVDGDDFVYTDTLRQFLSKIREGTYAADWIMTDYYTDRYSDGQRTLVEQIGSRTLRGLEHLPEVICKTSAYWPVWRGAYKASFLKKHGLQFCDTVFNEDADFTAKLLSAEPEALFVDAPYYHYRRSRAGSLMNENTFLRMQQNEEIFRRSIQLLRGRQNAWVPEAVSGLQYGYVMNIALLNEVLPAERKDGTRVFLNWADALVPSSDRWVTLLSVLAKAFGIRFVSAILHVLKRGKRKLS